MVRTLARIGAAVALLGSVLAFTAAPVLASPECGAGQPELRFYSDDSGQNWIGSICVGSGKDADFSDQSAYMQNSDNDNVESIRIYPPVSGDTWVASLYAHNNYGTPLINYSTSVYGKFIDLPSEWDNRISSAKMQDYTAS